MNKLKLFLCALPLCFASVTMAQVVDADADGVDDAVDVCLDTPAVDTAGIKGHRHNRYLLTDPQSLEMVSGTKPGKGKGSPFFWAPVPLAATGGCSCDQIIERLELGMGHVKFGCSVGAINDWITSLEEVEPEPEPEPDPE